MLVSESRSMAFLPGRVQSKSPAASSDTLLQDDGDDESGITLPQPEEATSDDGSLASRHSDLKLQTKLSSDRLQQRLLEMYYDAHTFIEEQGVNILYLGLGQLKWFDNNSPETERLAPLILLPVTLERKSAAERFVLKSLREDATENLSLAAKLKADFGLILPDLHGGDDFDPVAYLDRIAESLSSQDTWEVRPDAMALGFFSFAKFLMYRDLDPESWPADQRIDQQNLITSTLESGFPAKDEIFPEDIHVDEVVPVAEQRHVVDADSSQSLAIEAVRRGENLVIQGPPGTGKSQTITNIIAAAVSDGKRVLFLSEKMAALEVVHRRLASIGLGPACLELHSHHANKRRVLEELKVTRELGRPKIASRDQIVFDLEKARVRLNRHAETMHVPCAPSGLTPFQVLGNLVRLADISLTGLPTLLDTPENWSQEAYSIGRNLCHDITLKAAKIGDVKAHPWRGVSLVSILRIDAERLLDQTRTLEASLLSLENESQIFCSALGMPSVHTIQYLAEYIELSQQMGAAPALDRSTVASAIWSSGLDALRQLVDHGTQFSDSRARLHTTFTDSAWDEDIEACRRHIAAHGDSIFRVFSGEYRRALSTIKSHARNPLPKSHAQRVELLDDLIDSKKHRKALVEKHAEGQGAFGSFWKGEHSDWKQLHAVSVWMSGQDGNGLSDTFRTLYANLPSPERCAELGRALALTLAEFETAFNALLVAWQLDLPEAFDAQEPRHISLKEFHNRLRAWLDSPDSVHDWIQFASVRAAACSQGMGALIRQFEAGSVQIEKFEKTYERAYYEQMLRFLSQKDAALASFDGDLHNECVETFRELDRQRIELARAETALRHYERIPRGNSGIGPMGTLNGEIARKRGHMPLRKLFKLAGHAVQAIKPVFMMSPLSIAQFLEPGAIEFDLLVIDEASQIEPVDALGGIARSKQLVVVGDDRQLPPTRFFSRMTTEVEVDEDDDEAYVAGAGDVESILSLCIAKGMPQMMLRWHYRSRHQSLIAVSNQQFYQNRLFVVPSPYTTESGMGLRFNHVPSGTFDSGGSRVNREEARTIAAAIVDHVRTNPERSLGVAAFSLQQKIAIQDELELLRRRHPEIEAFFTDHPNEPFFIKNLENVQGDERDVIFISVAYARNSTGYLPMKFGPVGSDGGERRLNVLISRAKIRCEVFSSITAEDIDLERAKGKGVAALKVFLNYAATGRLAVATRTDRELDSPFEEEVLRSLTAEGMTVHPQVGIAGFFVDLGIVDPESAGRYLLGVECDGASYHSTRSARDRDRLRQSVLEDHGWILHRIWSSDWFRQPQAELLKIKTALQAAKAEIDARQEASQAGQRKGTIQINFVDRENDTLIQIDAASNLPPPYEEAAFVVPNQQELHEVPITRLAQILLQIVAVEGPIHFDEVVARTRTLWGLQRAGSRIRDVLDRARQMLMADRRVSSEDQFLDIPEREVRVRNRASVCSATLRKPEFLPPVEVRAAIRSVLRENLGGHRNELSIAVGRLLGFGTVSAQLREVIWTQLDALHGDGSVSVQGEIYRDSTMIEGGCVGLTSDGLHEATL
ncbi:putative DNA helicase related protein [Burkholderia sp. YI23]|nr:putative DNA helicase related protein [Burkholderia sp. YI23]